MDDATNFADVLALAIMAITAIIIVGIVFFTRARAGVEQLRRLELERDEAQRRADRLEVRVTQLEDRLDRRVSRELTQEEFDRQLEK